MLYDGAIVFGPPVIICKEVEYRRAPASAASTEKMPP